MYWLYNHNCPECLLQKTVQQLLTIFQCYGGICFQKNNLNQTSYHLHFQNSSIWYIEVITWLIYGSPVLVQIQFCKIQKILDGNQYEFDEYEPFMTDKLLAPQSVIELSMCSCKKRNCNSLRCNSKKKGLVCTDMCQCLNCSNIKFDKPEFEWEIIIQSWYVYADELSAAEYKIKP